MFGTASWFWKQLLFGTAFSLFVVADSFGQASSPPQKTPPNASEATPGDFADVTQNLVAPVDECNGDVTTSIS